MALLTLVVWMLVWCWRDQAGAGLGELRTPAVRNLVLSVLLLWRVVPALLGRRIFWDDYAFDAGVVYDHHSDVCEVACVDELWLSRGGTRPSFLCGVGRGLVWSWCRLLLIRLSSDRHGTAAAAILS